MDTITNERIAGDVRDTLARDPRIPYPQEIAVESQDGMATLRGTVGSFSQLRAAVAAAKRTPGVYDVYDELKVRLLDADRRVDAEIRGAALQRLAWDPGLPADDIDVKVDDGWLTLTGRVDHQYQSDLAFDHVASLYGVLGVTNDLKVVEML
jgi:osmotically-inducible protein OsmY